MKVQASQGFVSPLPLRLKSQSRRQQLAPICSAASPPSQQSSTLRTPPVHFRIPLIGYILDKALDRLDAPRLAARYGPVYKSDLIGSPITVVTDLDAVKSCSRDGTTFASVGAYPVYFRTLLGSSATIFLDGKEHKVRRMSIAPAFTANILPNYLPGMLSSAEKLWNDIAEEGRVILKEHARAHFLRVIAKIVVGLPGDDPRLAEVKPRFEQFILGLNTIPHGPEWRAAIRAREELLVIFRKLIDTRLSEDTSIVKELREVGHNVSGLSARYLASGVIDVLTVAIATSPLDLSPSAKNDPEVLERIANSMQNLFNAGSMTQTSSLMSCVMEMGFDANIYRRLQQEQDEIVAAAGGVRTVTMEQISASKLLDSFLTEVHRMYPPGTSVLRRATVDTSVCGFQVKKGETLQLDIWAANRDSKHFLEPNRLIMDRFIDEPAPHFPLSFGAPGSPHYCIGTAMARLSLKATLSVLLRNYDFELNPSQKRGYRKVPQMEPWSGVEVLQMRKRR